MNAGSKVEDIFRIDVNWVVLVRDGINTCMCIEWLRSGRREKWARNALAEQSRRLFKIDTWTYIRRPVVSARFVKYFLRTRLKWFMRSTKNGLKAMNKKNETGAFGACAHSLWNAHALFRISRGLLQSPSQMSCVYMRYWYRVQTELICFYLNIDWGCVRRFCILWGLLSIGRLKLNFVKRAKTFFVYEYFQFLLKQTSKHISEIWKI